MTRNAYIAQEAMVSAARAYPQLWRLFAGLILAAIVVIALNSALMAFLAGRLSAGESVQGGSPLTMLVTLYSFGFLIVGVGVSARALHQRGLETVFGPLIPCMVQFRNVALVIVALGAVLLILPPYNMGMELIPNTPVRVWLLLLPFGLLGVIIQSAAEEVLFRGYLQQQLAARFRSPLIWIGIPSALFAAGHYLPAQAGDNALIIAVWSGVFGVLMADLTARAGTLGPAIAVHVANNASALLIVSLPDSLNGLALYVTPITMSDTETLRAWMPVDFATTFVFWLAARLAIRR
ncbi:MAG: lysostaphin resistance A-like protein [Paracoccaceae bacterium]